MILEWGCGRQGVIALPILFKILTYGLHTQTHKRDQHSTLLEMIQTEHSK